MTQHLLKTALGQALGEARKRTPGKKGRPLSQGTIAAYLGVDKSTVTAWEGGHGGLPGDEVLNGYAKLCKTTYAALIDRASKIVEAEAKRRGHGGASR